MSFSKLTIIGNLGSEPELKYTPQQTAVCNFTVATNEGRGEDQVTTWFRVTAWRKTAEACAKALKKGSLVYVEGSLQVENWVNKEGKNQVTLNLQAANVQFLANLREFDERPDVAEEAESSPLQKAAPSSSDDIPF